MVMATAKLLVLLRLSSNDNFEWLHKTEIWQCLTDLDKKRQGPTIYLSLNHNERKTCSDTKVKDFDRADGVNILIKN